MKGGTYLPYKAHPAFDRMAGDVAAILGLNLPDQDAFQYLQPLLGFHLYLYGIETRFCMVFLQSGASAYHLRDSLAPKEPSGEESRGGIISAQRRNRRTRRPQIHRRRMCSPMQSSTRY